MLSRDDKVKTQNQTNMYSRKLLNFPLRHFATRTPILRSARPHQPWQTRTMSLMQRPKTPWRWLSLLVSSAYRPRVLPESPRGQP